MDRDAIAAKLEALRSLLRDRQLDAYLIPTTDPHLNNASPNVWKRREWIGGFTGSAGELLVSTDAAWLFVDSRYYEQADLQVDPSLIQVVKLGLPEQPTLLGMLEKLAAETQRNWRLGFDPFTLSIEQFNLFLEKLPAKGGQLVPIGENLVDLVRNQAPWVESDPLQEFGRSLLFSLPESLTGETVEQKLARVREAMRSLNADILPVTNLNQIAWLFNLRGWDVLNIPLFIAYAIVANDAAYLFTNLERIPPEIQQQLQHLVNLKPYAAYAETLAGLIAQQQPCRVLLDPKHTTAGTYQIVLSQQSETGEASAKVLLNSNPIEGMKARKNTVEIEQMRRANFKASRAKSRAIAWIGKKLAGGKVLSELDVAGAIESFYKQETDFQQLSFKTIAATGANSSIVHYNSPSHVDLLKLGDFLLIDSGAQFLAGTTDDTRTAIVGEPAPLQIQRYTAVLIAHINCAMQQFPAGTTGVQIDAIARSALWQLGLDFGHGTGHGVGAFLSVHEGPNGISKLASHPLEAGMVTSIEPGYYEPGWGGIRIENLYVVKEISSDNGKTWLGFEPLTYIPFEKRLIDWQMLTVAQKDWLTNYHLAVVEKLAPTLDQAEVDWLKTACEVR